MTSLSRSVLIDSDPRGRVSLARVVKNDVAERYLAREEPGGVIVLEPAVVISAAQARLNEQPELHAQITAALDRPLEGRPRPPRRARVSERGELGSA